MIRACSQLSPSVLSRCCGCHKPIRLLKRHPHSKTSRNVKANPVLEYLKKLKWVPIPIGAGFALIGYQQFKRVKKREEHLIRNASDPEDIVANDWQVRLYTALPLRYMSRLWGRANSIVLPEWMRPPLLKTYIWMFGCNMDEAAISDLKHYKNLSEFFRRRLKPSCRPLNEMCQITSPSDGKVLCFGQVERGLVEQVKGVTYSLKGFLGPANWEESGCQEDTDLAADVTAADNKNCDLQTYQESLMSNKDNELYQCVIYLAPGDYHCFHSPVPWTVKYRRHFAGELLSVSPIVARWIKGLFVINERAVYVGSWRHGFFSMAAVGATNVGSMKIYFDQALKTNQADFSPPEKPHDKAFYDHTRNGIPVRKGEIFGEFNLGSTIVLIFEAPKNFKFSLKEGQKIKFGEPVGTFD